MLSRCVVETPIDTGHMIQNTAGIGQRCRSDLLSSDPTIGQYRPPVALRSWWSS